MSNFSFLGLISTFGSVFWMDYQQLSSKTLTKFEFQAITYVNNEWKWEDKILKEANFFMDNDTTLVQPVELLIRNWK